MIEEGLKIILAEDREISTVDDIYSIYDSFSLPSWFSEHLRPKITEGKIQENPSKFLYTVELGVDHEIRQYFFIETKGDRNKLTPIHYQVRSIEQDSKSYEINVLFEKSHEKKFIIIRVEDKDGFLKTMPKDNQTTRVPTRWPYRKDELYYPYIEPQNVRTVTTKDTPHFHMAFQGGGAKGAAYVGAVEALLENNLGVPIKSIIGSSAGGIIAMALAAGTSSSKLIGYCERMTEIPRDTTAKTRDEKVNKEKCDKISVQLKTAIQQYGLVPANAIPLVENILTPRFIETILELISLLMDGIEEMFLFPDEVNEDSNDSRVGLDANKTGNPKKGNFYGLLQGQLLKGDAVKNLTLDILVEYLSKESTNRELIESWYPEFRNYNAEIIRSVAESLTMLQFYQLSDVEFTVTSVDIDSKILRFFNHKTTPSLPVHMAVIMTGSFPVAFEARKWESRWGKYYIHYERWRREIDLTGHQFTDGGVLANFPMMYLDNEDMRPMYFSRKCVYDDARKNNTRIIGFGLEEVEETNPKVDTTKRTASQIWDEMKSLAWRNLKWHQIARIVWHYFRAREQPGPPYDLSKIPIFNLAYKLLKTYMSANDHLVEQCFEMAICFQSPFNSFIKRIKAPSSQTQDAQSHEARDAEHLNNLNKLVNEAMEFGQSEKQLRADTLGYLQKKDKEICSIDDYEEVRGKLRKVLQALHYINVTKQFLLKSILEGEKSLQQHFKFEERHRTQLEEELTKIKGAISKGNTVLQELEAARIDEPLIKTVIAERISRLIEIWNKYPPQIPTLLKNPPETSSLNHLIAKWAGFPIRGELVTTEQKLMNLVVEKFKRYDVKEKLQFQSRIDEIRRYINSRLSSESCKNIHLVFQGRGEHSIFLYRIFKLVEDCLFKLKYHSQYEAEKKAAAFIEAAAFIVDKYVNTTRLQLNEKKQLGLVLEEQLEKNLPQLIERKKIVFRLQSERKIEIELAGDSLISDRLLALKKEVASRSNEQSYNHQITSVTCGSMHCFFGFLLAAGLSAEEVDNQWNFVEKSFTYDFKESMKKFDKQDWFLIKKHKLNKEFQDDIWKERYELFSHLQQQIKNAESYKQSPQAKEQLLAQLESIQIQFEESKGIILNSYDTILEHLLEKKAEYEDNKDFPQKLAQDMSIQFERENYFVKNKNISKETTKFVKIIQDYFEEQIRFILFFSASEMEKELVDHPSLEPKQKKDMWKCMVITRFLICKELKKKVRDILARLKLPRDISLKDFYEMAPRKLELTFPAVDLITKKMRFINQRTYPDMPVWAAVVIGSSLPMIFPIFDAKYQWCREISSNSSLRVVKAFFREESFSSSPHFVSGNMITNFPLDLLTNHKVRQEFFQFSNYTMLNFGVQKPQQPMESHNLNIEYKRKYLGLCQLGKLYKSFSLSQEGMNFKKSIRYTLLTTYMESHDNLVFELYNKELLQLPVRFSTLSFYKFNRTDGKMNPVLRTLLDETYFATKEKFGNLLQEQKDQEAGIQNLTYICAQVIMKPPTQDPPQDAKKILVLEFISKERSNQDFTRKYKIEYRFARKTKDEKTRKEKEVPWMKVVKQRIDVEQPTGQVQKQMVYLRFSYPVQVDKEGSKLQLKEPNPEIRELNSKIKEGKLEIKELTNEMKQPTFGIKEPNNEIKEDKPDTKEAKEAKFEIKESEFELDVSELWVLQSTHSDAIFEIDYKKVGMGQLALSKRFSQTKDTGNGDKLPTQRLPTQRLPNERIKLPYKSVICIETTGLYCRECCTQLVSSTSSLMRKCNNCNKLRFAAFKCQQNNHQSFCLDCCKNHAILKKENHFQCKHGHPYVTRDDTKLPLQQKKGRIAICDICQSPVDIFYHDQGCNLSICTKCCTDLSLLHKSGK